MAILGIQVQDSGAVGGKPRTVKLQTNDTYAAITTAGYLSSFLMQSYSISATDIFEVNYDTNSLSTNFFQPLISNGVITLAPLTGSGEVILPVVSGDFAIFSGTTGSIADLGYSPTNAAKTKVVMANGATVANHLMISTDTAGTVGNKTGTALNDGSLQAGRSTVAGSVISFPSTAATGSLAVTAVSNSGDTVTTISNAAMGQASVISIPDPGASTANFLLDAGSANTLTDNQVFVGLENIILIGTGTWTTTRIAEGNYATVHTATAETSLIGIDITRAIRTTSNKGFKLASIDVVYSIGTLALNAHSMTLDKIAYANNTAVAITSVPLTGSLATATQAQPYLTNIAVTTPAFDNTTNSKYVVEVTVNAAATSAYSFYGLNLHFSQTII